MSWGSCVPQRFLSRLKLGKDSVTLNPRFQDQVGVETPLSWYGMSAAWNPQPRSLRVASLRGYRPEGLKIPVAQEVGCAVISDEIKG